MPRTRRAPAAAPARGNAAAVATAVSLLVVVYVVIAEMRFLWSTMRPDAPSDRESVAAAVTVANHQIVAVLVSAVVGVVVHEGAHALAALVFRLPILGVQIGSGPRLVRLGRLTVRMVPFSGHVRVLPQRRGFVPFLLAGNVGTGAVAVAFWLLASSGPWHPYQWALVGTQCWYVLNNAIPWTPRPGSLLNDATRLQVWRVRGDRWTYGRAPSLPRVPPLSPLSPSASRVAATPAAVDDVLGVMSRRREFLALVDAGRRDDARRYFALYEGELGNDRHLLLRLLS